MVKTICRWRCFLAFAVVVVAIELLMMMFLLQVEMLPSLASLPEGLQQALTMQEEQVRLGDVPNILWKRSVWPQLWFSSRPSSSRFQAALIVRLGLKQSPVESLLSQVFLKSIVQIIFNFLHTNPFNWKLDKLHFFLFGRSELVKRENLKIKLLFCRLTPWF